MTKSNHLTLPTLLSVVCLTLGSGVVDSLANGALAQGSGEPAAAPAVSPLSPTAPPELIKPALPSEIQTPESVFRKLDVGKRGYVTLEDTKDLIGFADAFRAADSDGHGQLTVTQFRKAWSIYQSKK